MAGMMMFDNAGTFNQGYANGLAGLAMNSQGDKRQSALAKLAGVDANAAYKIKQQTDEQDYSGLVKAANVMRAFKGTPQADQAYASLAPRISQQYGIEMPSQLDDTVWQAVDQIAQAAGGSTSDNVQSTFIDPEGNLNYLSRGGQTVNTGKRVSDKFSPMVDPVTGQVSGYSSRGNNLAPTFAGNQSSGMSEGDLTTYLNALNAKGQELVAAGNDKAQVNAWMDDQIANLPKVFIASPSQARVNVKPEAPKSQSRPMSAQEIASYGLPAGTSATIDSNGSVNVLNKPMAEPKKQADANVVKQAAQLPSLLRRIQRVADASGKLGFAGVDGGPIDQMALKYSPSGQELESAVGQLRAMLLPFVRVPGVGSQSDLEARLDALQYPDASQPPAVRKRNIDELNAFVKDLSNVYTTMIKGGQAPAAPASNRDALLDKY